jgi:TetR/AcrR family transcriptional regulator, transcriptional repressor for nem operon
MNDSRQHIINISLGLFLSKSFKDVTLSEIVKLTGLSKGAFYHYFESKEVLLKEVLEQFVANFMSTNWDSLSSTTLLKFIDEYHSISANRIDNLNSKLISEFKIDYDINYYALFFDAIRVVPEFKITIHKKQAAELAAWKHVISKALKTGEIHSKMSAEQIARLFIYIPDGFFMENVFLEGESAENKPLVSIKSLWKDLYRQLSK